MWKFKEWSDGSVENPRTINLSGDMALTAIYEEEKVSFQVQTNAEGKYVIPIPLAEIGLYDMTVGKEGFESQEEKGVPVEANQITTKDFVLVDAQGIVGTVLDARGTPIEGATVTATKQP